MCTTPPKPLYAPAATKTVPLLAAETVLGLTAARACELLARLTRRERQVAALIARGKPNREIAAELGITTKTLDVHRNSVKNKLHARTLAQIANVVHLVSIAESAHL